MKYQATVNVPGYLPMDNAAHVFDSAREAWEWLRSERERDLDSVDYYEPEFDEDPCLEEIDGLIDHPETGTVYGRSPLYTHEDDSGREYDLGLRYTVSIVHASYPHKSGRLYGCEACESQCQCTGDPGHTQCVFCAIQAEGEFQSMSESALSDS